MGIRRRHQRSDLRSSHNNRNRLDGADGTSRAIHKTVCTGQPIRHSKAYVAKGGSELSFEFLRSGPASARTSLERLDCRQSGLPNRVETAFNGSLQNCSQRREGDRSQRGRGGGDHD
jgi:hypothetical protein